MKRRRSVCLKLECMTFALSRVCGKRGGYYIIGLSIHHMYLYQFANYSRFSILLVQWLSDRIISYRDEQWSRYKEG